MSQIQSKAVGLKQEAIDLEQIGPNELRDISGGQSPGKLPGRLEDQLRKNPDLRELLRINPNILDKFPKNASPFELGFSLATLESLSKFGAPSIDSFFP